MSGTGAEPPARTQRQAGPARACRGPRGARCRTRATKRQRPVRHEVLERAWAHPEVRADLRGPRVNGKLGHVRGPPCLESRRGASAPPAQPDRALGVGVIAQQLLEPPGTVVQEIACHDMVLRVLVGDLGHTAVVELDDPGMRIGQQDRRVRRDDELGGGLDQLVNRALSRCRLGDRAASGSSIR